MSNHDLKPCQKEALKSVEWHDSYLQKDQIVERVNFSKCGRHKEVWLRLETKDHLVFERAKRALILHLCEGCKEAASDENV